MSVAKNAWQVLVSLLLLLPAAWGAAAEGPIPGCPDLVWGTLPAPGGSPFADEEALCSAIPGEPLPAELLPPLPPLSLDEQNAYDERLHDFLNRRAFATELGWAGDAHWRLSGDLEGCPSATSFASFGVHLLVRVWYSPEVVAWMCGGRTTELPAGAAMVKEEHLFRGEGAIIVERDTHRAGTAQSLEPQIFSVMVKQPEGAWDQYYWGAVGRNETANPPIFDPAGLTQPSPPTLPAHAPPLYPTGASTDLLPLGSVVYRNFGYGMYCVNCHSGAASEQTFSAIENILGHELVFSWRGPGTRISCDAAPSEGAQADSGTADPVVTKFCPQPFPPAPLGVPDLAFLALYDEVPPVTADEAWNGVDISLGTSMPPNLQPLRYPGGQTWDRITMSPPEDPLTFITSDQCIGCHDGTANNGLLPNMVLDAGHGRLLNLSPSSEWRSSSMGLAGRDPFFLARMEAEWNRVERDFARVPGLGEAAGPTVADCVMDLCLSCHAKAGHVEKSIDTKGNSTEPLPGSVLQVQNTYICRDLLPPPLREPLKTKEDGHDFFVRPDLQEWPGTTPIPSQASAANLGRDGVTCVACHLAGPDVGNPAAGFTGNIPYVRDGTLFAPDEIGAPGEVMQNAVGLSPEQGEQLRDSRLCGACHAINLPVLRSGDCTENPETSPFAGCVEKFDYEQTTYFEYLNSAYDPDSPSAEPGLTQECQGCHMQNTHAANGDEALEFVVANIQDDRFARYPNSLPEDALDPPVRTDYRRHAFPGLNLFLNGFFQQFPLLLGYADYDWMNQKTEMSVLTQRDTLLDFAREETARISLEDLSKTSAGLRASVRVINHTGHNLPSGVGFRRLFIELSVLDEDGNALWKSGRTDSLGQLLRADGEPLPSEHYPSTEHQPHHQVIRSENEVQIYEEVAREESGVVTTSFLHRWDVVKDNRIPPRGFRWDSIYVEPPYDVAPKGNALEDPDYTRADPSMPLDGTDHVTYEIALPPALRAQASTVRVRLISQSVPPYFLSQIFAELATAKQDPNLVATQRQLIVDGSFLHYIASHFDADAVRVDGEPYLEDWKLAIATDEKLVDDTRRAIRPRGGLLPIRP